MTQYGSGDMKQESHKTDEYVQKNPLDSTTASDHMKMGNTGTKGTGAGHGNEEGKHGGTGGILHQTGSGSSSSSEDDGEGGRRKKGGVMGKIKEKLPGGKPGAGDEQFKTSAAATTVGAGGGHGYEGEEGHEKKGMMDKIKEKLPKGNK